MVNARMTVTVDIAAYLPLRRESVKGDRMANSEWRVANGAVRTAISALFAPFAIRYSLFASLPVYHFSKLHPTE